MFISHLTLRQYCQMWKESGNPMPCVSGSQTRTYANSAVIQVLPGCWRGSTLFTLNSIDANDMPVDSIKLGQIGKCSNKLLLGVMSAVVLSLNGCLYTVMPCMTKAIQLFSCTPDRQGWQSLELPLVSPPAGSTCTTCGYIIEISSDLQR